jgi:hypothetical protein
LVIFFILNFPNFAKSTFADWINNIEASFIQFLGDSIDDCILLLPSIFSHIIFRHDLKIGYLLWFFPSGS